MGLTIPVPMSQKPSIKVSLLSRSCQLSERSRSSCGGPALYLSLKVTVVGLVEDLVLVDHGSEDHVVDLDGLADREWTEWWTELVGVGCEELRRRGLVSDDRLVLRFEIRQL